MIVTRTIKTLNKPEVISFKAKFLWAKDGHITFETENGVGCCLVSECEMEE